MRSLWMRQDDFGGVVQSGVQRFTGSGPYSSAFSGSGGVGLPRYSVSLGVERDRWGRLMEGYFASGLITAGVQIVDARHKPTADDVTMVNWFYDTGCPVIVAANKLDKLKKSEIEPNLLRIRETLELREEDRLIAFSAERGDGREELMAALEAALA